MAWVNYRAVVDRFSHIDAAFVRGTLALTGEEESLAEIVVRFYPWWEHPRYVDAVRTDGPWAFADFEEGKREIVVRAVRPRRAGCRCERS